MRASEEAGSHRVVLTGGAGFIGSHVADGLLAGGHDVIAVDDLSSGHEENLSAALRSDRFRFEHGDIRSARFRTLMKKEHPDVVVHMAAQVDVRRSMNDPIEDASLNVIGSLSVYEAARAAGAGTVMIASSGGTIYGEAKVPVAETARARPISPYGISKRVLNDYADYYRSNHGIRTVLLALGNVYGPRQDPHGEAGVVAIFLGRMLRGETPVIFGDGSAVRDYVFVTDVVDAFMRAMDGRHHGPVNIGTGVGTSVLDLFKACARAAGYKGKPRYEAERPGELRANFLDVSLAAKALGWKPRTSLQAGLKKTLASLM
jgi:UDP-glucose 4-epimerase